MNSPERPAQRRLAGLAVFIIGVIVYLPIARTDLSMLDEGALLYVAERLTKGDVLYRDIVTGIMPGVYYLQALLFSVLGYSVMAGRVLACATLALNALLLYAISTFFATRKTSFALSLLFVFTALPSYWMAGYSQVSITLVLTATLFFLRYIGSSGFFDLLISGVSAGLALVFKQNYGVFITAGLGLMLLARLALKREGRPVLVFSAAFLSPIIIMVFYFYCAGALPHMTEYTFLSLFKKAAGAYYKPYPLLSRADPLFFTHELYNFIPFRGLAIWSLKEGYVREAWVRAAVVVIYSLAPLIISASMLYSAIAIVRRRLGWAEATIFLVSALLFLGVFPRSDIHHLIFILPPLMVSGTLLATRLPLRGRTHQIARASAYILMGLFSALCLVSSYMPVFHPAPGREKAALQIPRAEGIRVEKREAGVIRAVTGHIRKNTGPDEPILVVPTGAMYYFLTGRRSVVPYPLIMPGAMDETRVIEAIERTRLRYIVYSDMSFDEETLSRHMPLIHGYIRENYHIDESYPLARTGGDVYVLRRGKAQEEVTPLDREAEEALGQMRGSSAPILSDLVKSIERARSGVILGDRTMAPLFRSNQVRRNAWLMKDAILQEPGRGWSKVYTAFSLHIPRGAALRFSIGQSPVVWSPWFGDGVLFEVFIYDKTTGKISRIFSRYLDPKNNISERRWFTYLAGLKKYEGHDLIVYFVTSGGPRFNLTMGEMNRWRQVDMAGWGEPALLYIGRGPGPAAEVLHVESPMASLPTPALALMAGFGDISFILREAKEHPGDYDVRLTLGRVYEERGEAGKASVEYGMGLDLYARGREARIRLARLLSKAGETARAKALIEEGLRLDPDEAGLNMAMAGLLLRGGDYQAAARYYAEALRARPGLYAARLGLGRTYIKARRADDALEEARKLVESYPENLPALMLLGDAYRLKKEWKKAEKTYRKALELFPRSALARTRLALTLSAEGRRAEALRAYRETLALENAPEEVRRLARKKITALEDSK